MFSDYNTPWSEYRAITNEKSNFLRCLQDHTADLALQNTRTCLSIGPGCGESDAFIVSNLMPQLQRYIAVEPDKGNTKELLPRVLEALPVEGRMELYYSCIEDAIGRVHWPVDVVLLLEVLYYIKDYEALFERLKRLLKPGSKIVASLLGSDNDLCKAVEASGLKKWNDMCKVEELIKSLYPDAMSTYITIPCSTDIKEFTVGSFSILTANADVGEDDLVEFKKLFTGSTIVEYELDIGIFEIKVA
ncbi:hypothetical protein CAPTEDRAFT_202159 [Capitella teleta]|uniref:Methyltransferase type 12 domain-containing protein n=1 Tax=Capitella teleta TaxID=283909 RepID=R7UAC1_CAPTE|nr:hypothetical protein CAPTEDRAFT_202159 [Capitella teleta]|eukprot:ELU00763.1 hypothetical protein CAPTEDRAFT_202159 [Capitella teleta]